MAAIEPGTAPAQERKLPKDWTSEDKMTAVEAWKASGLSQRAYADKIGVNESTLAYWHSRWKKVHKVKPAQEKQVKAPATVGAFDLAKENQLLKAQIQTLIDDNDELAGKLDGETHKVKALQEVIAIIGHQLVDEA